MSFPRVEEEEEEEVCGLCFRVPRERRIRTAAGLEEELGTAIGSERRGWSWHQRLQMESSWIEFSLRG